MICKFTFFIAKVSNFINTVVNKFSPRSPQLAVKVVVVKIVSAVTPCLPPKLESAVDPEVLISYWLKPSESVAEFEEVAKIKTLLSILE